MVEFQQEIQQRKVVEAMDREARRDEMEQADHLRRLMRVWSRGCVICLAMGQDG